MARWLSIAFATALLWAGMQPAMACACPVVGERTVQVVDPDCPCGQRMIDVPVEGESPTGCGCGCTVGGTPATEPASTVLAAGTVRDASSLLPAPPHTAPIPTPVQAQHHARLPGGAPALRTPHAHPPPTHRALHSSTLQVFRC